MAKTSAWPLLKQTVKEFSEDNVLRLSAALAYYSVFSIGPLLAIVVGLAGLAFGASSVRHQVEGQLQGLLGAGAAKTVESMMSARRQGTSLITTILGVAALLFGAGGVFGQLQDSLNTIWEVTTKPGSGMWNILRKRFLSFSMVLGVGFLLLVSMALSTALTAMTTSIGSRLPMAEGMAHILDFVVSFAVVSFLFAMIFKFLPDVRVPWSKVWIGGIGTAMLFSLGKILLGLYLGREATASAYGAAGSVIVILMWVYYASVILFFGAEFTQVYTRQSGVVVQPRSYAISVTEEQRAQQGMADPERLRNELPENSSEPNHTGSEKKWTPGQNIAQRQFKPLGEVVQNHNKEMMSLMLVTGFIAGAVLVSKPLRKGIKLYGKVCKAVQVAQN